MARALCLPRRQLFANLGFKFAGLSVTFARDLSPWTDVWSLCP